MMSLQSSSSAPQGCKICTLHLTVRSYQGLNPIHMNTRLFSYQTTETLMQVTAIDPGGSGLYVLCSSYLMASIKQQFYTIQIQQSIRVTEVVRTTPLKRMPERAVVQFLILIAAPAWGSDSSSVQLGPLSRSPDNSHSLSVPIDTIWKVISITIQLPTIIAY